MLILMSDVGQDLLMPMTKYGTWKLSKGYLNIKFLEDYFPSHIDRSIEGLIRKGWVVKKDTPQGVVVQITSKGKEQVLQFDLGKLAPKTGNWDGKWRVVFFDVEELSRSRRDRLRKYLKQMNLYPMQESVYVSPYDIESEVKYLREILNIPHSVKLGIMEQLENSQDLKLIFGL